MNTDPNTNAEGSRKPNKSAKSIPSNDGMSNFVFGKLQPQALPLEEAVLGAMLLDRDALPMVMDILQADTFYLEAHQHIFRAIIRLFERSNPVDILTVTEELRKNGELDKVGGAYYLVELSNRVASAANIEYHARIIAQKRIQRELIRVSTLTIRDAYDETVDVFNLLDAAEKGLFDITQNNLSRTFASMGDLSSKVLKHLEEMAAKNDGLTGVPSGFTALDKLTSGWQPSDLAIIAARPGMGKTSFVLAVALNAARDFNKGVAIFSLEMANTQLVQRLISLECEIPGSKMRSGKLEDYEWQMLQTTVERLNNVPIFIDDTAGINIFELRAKCRRLKMQHDIQLVIIDYLQLMSGGTENGRNSNREQEIAGISRALKSMAKELNVPVIALSQLSRAVETRGGSKRPQLSDLRESGCLTGDALVLDIISGKRIPIKELAERATSEQFMVAALDESDMKLRPYAMSKAFYSGKKPVFELQTASGRSIKASANHPFYTIGGWKRLDELRVGEPLGLARVVEAVSPADRITDDELILLAHLIGDGCILPKQPYHYTSADVENIEIVRATAQALFGIEGKIVPQKNWHHIYLPSPYQLTHGVKHPITRWFEVLGIARHRSYEKRLPEVLFESNPQKIALFLHHLWATDGNISWSKGKNRDVPAIYYSTTSAGLAEQIQHLLLRLGVWSTRRVTQKASYRQSYNIWIQGKTNQAMFLRHVGCFGQRGKYVGEMLDSLDQYEANPNNDVIPADAWKLMVRPAKDAVGLSWRDASAKLGMSYCGSTLFKSGISRNRMLRLHEVTNDIQLRNLAESDIFWDKIKNIAPLGVQDVYDATVPGAHNFLANDFIVHNSIEQDADIVSFIYRPEYYGILEDESGQSLKGVAEIIIAKHRHGALDNVKLKFIDQFAKFANLDDPTFTGVQQAGASGFNPSTVIARPSRMNTDEDVPF